MDHRLRISCTIRSGNQATPSFIDDDNIASYYISQSTNDAEYFDTTVPRTLAPLPMLALLSTGPRGTRLQFLNRTIYARSWLSSTYLFTTTGTTAEQRVTLGAADNVYQLDYHCSNYWCHNWISSQLSRVRYVKYKSAVS